MCFSANLVLHRTIERIHVGKKYGDIPRGIFIVRGENVVLLGEVVSSGSTNLQNEPPLSNTSTTRGNTISNVLKERSHILFTGT